MPEQSESEIEVLENPEEILEDHVISERPKSIDSDQERTQESVKKISEGYSEILQELKSKSPEEIRAIADAIITQSDFPSEDKDKYTSIFVHHLRNVQDQLNDEALKKAKNMLQERLDKDLDERKDLFRYRK